MSTNTSKKLTGSILTIILLAVCLCISTFALIFSMVSVENNLFHTGTIDINLNDGKPLITADEFLFEPGMTVKNDGTWDVYYKLYFENVSGGLSDVLQIRIQDGDRVLFEGTAESLSRKNVIAADDVLKIGERRTLTAYFHFPEETGNQAQDLTLSFDLCADAVQTKNNPDRVFE